MWKLAIFTGLLALTVPSAAGATSGAEPDDLLPEERPVSTAPGTEPGVHARLIPATMVLPEYPRAARRGRIKGLVQLSGVIDEEGRVRDLECVNCKGDSTGFRRAAMEAVETWSYSPALTPDGTPVSVSILFEVRFLPE